MNEEALSLGNLYLHVEGRRYLLESSGDYDVIPVEEGAEGAILDATGYEQTGSVKWVFLNEPTNSKLTKSMVTYLQLEAGSYPEGTHWTREVKDFIRNFTPHIK